MAIGHPYYLFPVRRKHGEAVEMTRGGDALQIGAIIVDQIQMEGWRPIRLAVLLIRSINDVSTVGMKEWRKVRRAVMRDGTLFAPIGVHHEDFQLARLYHVLFQER